MLNLISYYLISFFLSACATAAPNLKDIQLPPGFAIEIFTDKTPGARSLALDQKNGIIFVGTREESKVYAVLDNDKNGTAEKVITLASGLNSPNGVAFHQGDLYVAEINRILRYQNISEHLSKPPKPQVIYNQYPTDRHHGWKYIAFGPDGHLYVPVGAPCNICLSENPIYASITRLNVKTKAMEIFASGVRNSVGFAWHPETKELWFTDNGRDWLGDNKPPCELNHAPQIGMNFGYPFCHGKDIQDPEYNDKPCQSFTPPARELGPHVAPLGMKFYDKAQFPKKYHNQIFIAEHGSWNRSEKIGYRVTLVTLKDNKPTSYETFAQGWLKNGRVSGRPVDLLIMPDGSMLVSDDHAGVIYRISYKVGKEPTP